jgi:hypothetical protein
MRTFSFSTLPIVALGLGLGLSGAARAQTTCTGLCLQQTTCTGNATTSVTGVVYAPNGTDPLPNVTVYVPNAPVEAFTPGVSCPISGSPPSGSPLVGTITDVNGKFTLVDMPVGANIPIVAVSGRWRVLTTVNTVACSNTTMILSMPQNHTQGDIPKIAIATGSADQVECVLLKMGINQSEFTDPGGTGRINLFGGGTNGQGAGVTLDAKTPTQDSLMATASTLNQYDVLMLPCEGGAYAKPDAELQNLIAFANDGGRVYTSHYGYAWMFQNPPFNSVANWTASFMAGSSITPNPSSGTATVNTSFTAGQTLATWLQNVGASISPAQMALNTLRIDQNGVIAPTQSWLTLNNSNYSNPVMQFVFDTPIPSATNPTPNQCGRVLYNEYHVENSSVLAGTLFPNECNTSAAMTPQEKLLEYMLFELTDEGGQPSLAPLTQDFGPEAVTYPSAPQTFTWTNNSSFAAQVSSVVFTGTNAADFNLTSNGCGAVAAGTSCPITVVFTPSLLGAESATLNVLSAGITLTATLTGTGVPGFTLTPGSLSFGNQDVGFASAPLTLTLTSNASRPLAVPAFATTSAGEYAVNQAACGSSLAALASCQIGVTFKPAATGAQSGSFAVSAANSPGPGSLIYSGLNATLSGTGVDFTISLNPTAGSVAAGDGTTTTATVTPIAGFSAPLFVSCAVAAGATAAVCSLSSAALTPPAAATTVVSIGTTSQYTVIGYSGFGGRGLLWLVAAASGWLLWQRRRGGRVFLPHLKFEMWGTRGLLLVLLAAMGLGLTSCTGKLPAENPAWTAPGNYTVTVTATDGQLSHSVTYSLTVR